ncbi:MAG: DUF2795 domain-containing protein [Patescibacteria group bacterium]
MPYLMPDGGRAERVLQKIDYPTTKGNLIEQAISRGASEDMIIMLEDLPVEAFDGISATKVTPQVTRI